MTERTTYFQVDYDLSDTTALSDSTPATTNNKEFADITLLKQNISANSYLTLEHNFSVLNDSLVELPENPDDVAFFSTEMSNENGEFTVNPVIDITFTTYHSSYAFTMTFLRDHPLQAHIVWYRDNTILYRDTYDIDSELYIIKRDIQLYNRVRIEFTKAMPYHYIKLVFLRYGLFVAWDETNIKSASLVQEVNRLSDKISINTMSFEVIDVGDELNFGNINGMHNYYQRNQPMYPYEIIDGQRISLGTFFLNKFSNDKNLGKMAAQSYLGILDTIQFNEGQVYNGATAGSVLERIFEIGGVSSYSIDEETAEQLLYGTIKPMSCRNALKEVLFACQSVIDTTQPDLLVVKKSEKSITKTISRDIKFSTTVSKTEYVSGVEIKYTTYTLSEQRSQIAKSNYIAGKHKIIFSAPYADVQITGATVEKIAPYYVEFNVETDGEVTVTGLQYTTVNNSVVQSKNYIDPGEAENIKTYTSALCNAHTAITLANKILEYLSLYRLSIKTKYMADNNSMSNMQIVENSTKNMNNYICRFEKRSINLTGGFIDTAQLAGYFDTADYYYYLGDELYAEDNFIL